jgi:carbonic anhydrase
MTRQDPEFFTRLTRQQVPEYLWVGCSDSRVPANEIVGLPPGELFVHRNVANVVLHADANCLSCMQYAVDVLKVKHIIVCGHYGCGGVLAALRDDRLGLSDNWLRHLQDVRWKHRDELDALASERERHHRLCELNVIEQVVNVSHTTVVREAWAREQPLAVHGMVYALGDGLLRDLGVSVADEGEVPGWNEKALPGFAPPASPLPSSEDVQRENAALLEEALEPLQSTGSEYPRFEARYRDNINLDRAVYVEVRCEDCEPADMAAQVLEAIWLSEITPIASIAVAVRLVDNGDVVHGERFGYDLPDDEVELTERFGERPVESLPDDD